MKNRFLCILFSAATLLVGCVHVNKGEEAVRDIVLESYFLNMEETTFAESEILDGNGGYRIVYPKKICYFDENWHGGVVTDEHYIDYSEDYLRVFIIERKGKSYIRAERVLPSDQEAEGYFMLTDSKGKKRLLNVSEPIKTGIFSDWNEFEEQMINDPDYWQSE